MATKVMDCDLVELCAGGCGLVAAVKAADVSAIRDKGERWILS